MSNKCIHGLTIDLEWCGECFRSEQLSQRSPRDERIEEALEELARAVSPPVPDYNPKTAVGGANKLPLHLIPPAALYEIAMAFADGGTKYKPYNWREDRISASVYYGAALRHLFLWWEGEDRAEDSNVSHLAHVAACMIMLLDVHGTPLLNDNRPPNIHSPASDRMEEVASLLGRLKNRDNVKFDLHHTQHSKQADLPEPDRPYICSLSNGGEYKFYAEDRALAGDHAEKLARDFNCHVLDVRLA